MAGGYDGTKGYPDSTDYNTTLLLVNDKIFEEGEKVVKCVYLLKYINVTCFAFFQLPFRSKSHCMIGLDDNTYILVGGERDDSSK